MSSARPSTLPLLLLAALATGSVTAASAAPKEPAPAATTPGVSLKASLKYVDGSKGEVPAWREIRVTIVRDGEPLATDQLLPIGANSSYFAPPKLKAVDLDDDREPEVLIDVFTASQDRERRTIVLRKSGSRYVAEVTDWGTGGYRLDDVVGKRSPEFLSSDSRVPDLYGSKARGPLRVVAFDGGRVRDVSRQARAELLRDAKLQRRALTRARRAGADTRAQLAAYAIDLLRLGRTEQAQSELRAAGRRGELRSSTKSFARQLDRELVRWDYAKRSRLASGL